MEPIYLVGYAPDDWNGPRRDQDDLYWSGRTYITRNAESDIQNNVRKTRRYFAKLYAATQRQRGGPELDNYCEIVENLRGLLPQNLTTFASAHDFPISAAGCELQVSLILVERGLYRQAIISLRSALELGLLSVYYNRSATARERVRRWYHSNRGERGPQNGLLFGGLLKIPNIANFNLWCETELKIKKGWVGRVRKLQDKLNNYVHSNGERYAPLKSQGWEPGWGAYNIALPFRVDKLEEWMEMYRQVVREVAIAHILLYPIALSGVDIRGKFSSFDPAQGTLGAGQSARLMTILPRREVQYLNQIAEQDVCTKQFLAYVEALPIISKRDDREVHEFLSRKFGESDKGRRYDGWCRQKVAHLGSPSLMTVIFGSAPNNYAVRRAWVEKYAHEYTQMDEVKHLWPPPFEAKD